MEVPPWQLKQLAVKMGRTSRSNVMAWAKTEATEQRVPTWRLNRSSSPRVASEHRLCFKSPSLSAPSPGLRPPSPHIRERELAFLLPKQVNIRDLLVGP